MFIVWSWRGTFNALLGTLTYFNILFRFFYSYCLKLIYKRICIDYFIPELFVIIGCFVIEKRVFEIYCLIFVLNNKFEILFQTYHCTIVLFIYWIILLNIFYYIHIFILNILLKKLIILWRKIYLRKIKILILYWIINKGVRFFIRFIKIIIKKNFLIIQIQLIYFW